MALIRATALFKPYPAEVAYKQKVKLKPIEHHYEDEGQEPYIKYSCPLCEQIAENMNKVIFEEDRKFTRFSIIRGTEQCPCCGIYFDWK